MANETTVGGIVGFLRLDNDQFVRAINQAIAKSEQLDGKQIDVQVDADTAGANAQLAATKRQVEDLDRTNAKIAQSGNRAGRGMRPLVAAVISLGPALIPVAAGATALGVAFGGMATAGVFAVVGIKKEMEEGTAVGDAYSAAIDGAKGNLTDLARVAAGNVLRPFMNAVADLNARMPQLRRQIGDLASVTGTAAAALAGGLLNAFRTLEPLMIDASVYILRLSESFRTAMSGQGVVAFGDYIRSVFPQVLDAIDSIAAAAGHLVASLATLGLGVLTGLQMLSDLLRLIPTEVLATLATGAYSVWLGFRVWKGISGLVDSANAALGRMNGTLALSAGAMRGLHVAAGVIGIALAGLAWIVSRNAEATREQQSRVDSLTDAFKASHGAIDQAIRDHQYLTLQQAGAIDAAKRLGIGLDTVTQASLGNGAALAEVNGIIAARIKANQDAAKVDTQVSAGRAKENNDLRILREALSGANGELTAGKQRYLDYRDAMDTATAATTGQATETQRLAAMFGTSAGAYQAAAEGQKKVADQAAAATLQMQLENNAAGLLKQSLDLLNGKTLDLASAQTTSASATLSVSSALKESNGQLKLNTKEGVASRQSLEAKARADQAVAEATAKATGSTKAGTKSLADSKAQLEKTLKSQGLLTDEVQGYINKLYQVPKVAPTKAELEIAAAKKRVDDLRAYIASLKSKTVTVTMVTRYIEEGARSARTGRGRLGSEPMATGGIVGLAKGGPVPGFAGGTLVGPGTGTSDSILAMVRDTGRMLALSTGEFVSTDASRRRNQGALEAGNRGATLKVAGRDGGGVDAERLEVLFMRLLAELRRKPLRAQVSTSGFDQEMGAMLP